MFVQIYIYTIRMHIIIYNLYSCCPGVKKNYLRHKRESWLQSIKGTYHCAVGGCWTRLALQSIQLAWGIVFQHVEFFCHVEQLPTYQCIGSNASINCFGFISRCWKRCCKLKIFFASAHVLHRTLNRFQCVWRFWGEFCAWFNQF